MWSGKYKGPAKARYVAATSVQVGIYKMGEHGAITFADGA